MTGLARSDEGEQHVLVTTLDLLAGGAVTHGAELARALDRTRARWAGQPTRRGPPKPRSDDPPIVQLVGALLGATAWPHADRWADAPDWLWSALTSVSAPTPAVTWAAEAGPDGLLQRYGRTSFAEDWTQLNGRRLALLLASDDPEERALALRSNQALTLDEVVAHAADASPVVHAALLSHAHAADLPEDVVVRLLGSAPEAGVRNEALPLDLVLAVVGADGGGSTRVLAALAGRTDISAAWLADKVASPSERVRASVASNRVTPPQALAQLADDPILSVRLCALGNASLPAADLRRLTDDDDEHVRTMAKIALVRLEQRGQGPVGG